MFDLDAFNLATQLLFQPITLIMLVVGVGIGIAIGVLPGLGPPVALSLALPFTFEMSFVPSIILLLSIYSASIYGGSISAIVARIPGQAQLLRRRKMAMQCFGRVGAEKHWVSR